MRGRQVAALVLREPRLRWRVDPRLPATIAGQRVRDVRRRAKYLIIDLDAGSLILHLGMSGSLRVLDPATPLSRTTTTTCCSNRVDACASTTRGDSAACIGRRATLRIIRSSRRSVRSRSPLRSTPTTSRAEHGGVELRSNSS
jgi:formamidopyrimidine-DNA glycosylase